MLGRDLILKKVLTETICKGLFFEAGLRADESLTWSVLAIPPILVRCRANRQESVILRFLSRDDCPQYKVKAEVQLKLSP